MGIRAPAILFSSVFRRTLYHNFPPLRCSVRVDNRSSAFSTTIGAMAALQRSALFEAMIQHRPDSTAIVHSLSGRSFTYASLLHDVALAKERLLEKTGKDETSIAGERVAFLIENSYDYVGTHYSCHQSRFNVGAKLKVRCSHSPLHLRQQRHCRPSCTIIPTIRAEIYPESQRLTRTSLLNQVLHSGRRYNERRDR